jgi:hypothetical protein
MVLSKKVILVREKHGPALFLKNLLVLDKPLLTISRELGVHLPGIVRAGG